jgi:hypothetical protein
MRVHRGGDHFMDPPQQQEATKVLPRAAKNVRARENLTP